MSQPLPQLPKPEFIVIHVKTSSGVPAQIAADLRETGIPGGLIGYEYRPLSEAAVLDGTGERGLVAIATSGLFGRVAIDAATGRMVHVPEVASAVANHVNKDLKSFNRCVAAVIARFPFYEDDEERCEEVAEEVREVISAIDGTALAKDGFWETFCDDVGMGDYANWVW
ncbi:MULTISPECIES: SUKH-4 family immunity protein [unclassified Streptomyces]|uniref:SUKH-4 family immunity protein n=1 Tax=unclassified Streptomyces TaxID=2593676 RepID=UPI002E806793|nr:SUKH-4 family immunity protein [Streptomyces sp. NBC_00589]WTI41924.1 SUKH-4 family immunity protein [Streptomyces sp. NBC_00775]WUB24393.1 SUKH-4 family immunity protein [Streptomyces sp. NBC_00589]